jgi:hypothetical protein
MARTLSHNDPHALLEQHRHLAQILDEISAAIAARRSRRGMIVTYFITLRDHVASHFTHEENGGYFSDALAEAPRLHRRALDLLEQHPQFLHSLDCMRAAAKNGDGSDAWWADIAAQFDEFTRLFREHEANEDTLLQEAYWEDIGAED